MDLKKPKRMRRPRAAASRMAQVSVESRKDGRVPGVAMVNLLKRKRDAHEETWATTVLNFLEKG
jgi:hypothetical protein